MQKLNLLTIPIILIVLLTTLPAIAQEDVKEEPETGYIFTDTKIVPHTPIKDQHRSGTCWSFAGTSFVEAEVLRNNGPELDLSEMFPVRYAYEKRADSYIRLHGAFNFGPGGEPHQVMKTIADKGMLTEEAYSGLTIGEELPVHGEMDNVLKAHVKAVVENKNRKVTPVWFKAYNGILDAYLGEIPEEFDYDGKVFTPKSFASEVVKLNPSDYVEITS